MAEDARRTTHPIQQPVANETEAMAVFDTITYSKGQAFIRMLESYLGEEKFRAGIRQYMKQHAFSSTTTADLWRALEAASGEPVARIAAAFTELAGVPLILAEAKCVDGEQRFALRQDRFTVHDPDASKQHWNVPIVFGPISGARPAQSFVLDEPFEIGTGACGEPVKLNLGDVGYYRVQYDAATQAALARSIAALAPADRVNLLADTWALVQAGRGAPANYFDMVDHLAGEDNRAVWDQIMRTFSRIDHLEQGRPGRAAFQAYARSKLRPVFARVGWDATNGETQDVATLRARLVGALGQFRRRSRPRRGEAPVRRLPARAGIAFHRPARAGHASGRPHRRSRRPTTPCWRSAARRRIPVSACAIIPPPPARSIRTSPRRSLAIALTDELPNSLVGALIFWVAAEHRELAWDYVRANFAALATKQGPSFRNTFASNLMANFADRERAAELASFAPVHETSGGRIVAARAEERILTDADFVAQQLPAVDDWIGRSGARPVKSAARRRPQGASRRTRIYDRT